MTARLVLLPVVVVAACATKRHVVTDYDRAARFSEYHTFTLLTRPHPGARDALVEQRTSDAIAAELTRKGFTSVLDGAKADFAVDFTVGANDRLDVRAYPAASGPWFHAGWWGNQVDVQQYQEGSLSIDVFDARSHRAVWHGSANKHLSQDDIANSRAVIRDAVAAVLAGFPPRE